LSTTVAITESVTTVTDNTTNVGVTVSPSTVQVTLSTGPVTIGGTTYSVATGSGSPLNVVTPAFAGQLYQDTATGFIYVSFTTNSSGWIELVRNF
jgi:hypothetical protein